MQNANASFPPRSALSGGSSSSPSVTAVSGEAIGLETSATYTQLENANFKSAGLPPPPSPATSVLSAGSVLAAPPPPPAYGAAAYGGAQEAGIYAVKAPR